MASDSLTEDVHVRFNESSLHSVDRMVKEFAFVNRSDFIRRAVYMMFHLLLLPREYYNRPFIEVINEISKM